MPTITAMPHEVHLVYLDSEGIEHYQPVSDLVESGTLIDPETGDDLEVVRVHIVTGDKNIIPADFWGQIRHQLHRISVEKPATFAAVRTILLSDAYPAIRQDIDRNGHRRFSENEAFFAGSGGDATLISALGAAGWQLNANGTRIHYSMTHPDTGESLTYIEGDLEAGAQELS